MNQVAMNRSQEWYRRLAFPAKSSVNLGAAGEYWLLDPTEYAGWKEVFDKAKRLGRCWSKADLAYRLAENLLSDVLAAAGGVELGILRLRTSSERLEQTKRAYAPKAVNSGLGSAAATEAYYAFADVMIWARAVADRVERRSTAKAVPPQGMLPAIKPKRLRKRVEQLLTDLRGDPHFAETRFLANFTVHAALVRHPYSGVDIDGSGRIVLPIPDRVAMPIAHRHLLEWHDNRDGFAVAEAVWQAVERFVDGVLDAFEAATPKRLRA